MAKERAKAVFINIIVPTASYLEGQHNASRGDDVGEKRREVPRLLYLRQLKLTADIRSAEPPRRLVRICKVSSDGKTDSDQSGLIRFQDFTN
jgi:hypothetical protein